MEQHDEMMLDFPPSLAAAKKMGGVPEGFAFYEFGWLGDRPEDFTVMQVRGAMFREAKTGPNKGRRTVKVPGTERTVFVTDQEIKAEAPNSEFSRGASAPSAGTPGCASPGDDDAR